MDDERTSRRGVLELRGMGWIVTTGDSVQGPETSMAERSKVYPPGGGCRLIEKWQQA
jgi:hypothetical protein